MVSVRQVKAARALLAWSQGDLATKAGVSEPTVARLESVDGVLGGRASTRGAIVHSLEAAGIGFVSEAGDMVGVTVKVNE